MLPILPICSQYSVEDESLWVGYVAWFTAKPTRGSWQIPPGDIAVRTRHYRRGCRYRFAVSEAGEAAYEGELGWHED